MTFDYECSGQGANNDHCCYIAGVRCPNLVENVNGRRYACGLVVEHGSFDEAMKDPRYTPIGNHWLEKCDRPFNYCKTFDPAFCCRPEFRNGRNNDAAEQAVSIHGNVG